MALSWAAMRWTAVSQGIPLASGAALIAAGIYQWTPWKTACLKHCRDPLSIIADHLHGGWAGGILLGFHHGAFCVGCCWALMLIQLVLGVMNIPVMAGVAVVIALEKMLPWGDLVAKITGAAAVLGGIFMAARSVF
jgi:predicted metal-binding membrane protein